jgi:DNA-directed RNA polymerase subunit RPC12/RpoP
MGRLIDLDKVEFLKVDGNIEFNHGVDCPQCKEKVIVKQTR